jgi:hypothetical protein
VAPTTNPTHRSRYLYGKVQGDLCLTFIAGIELSLNPVAGKDNRGRDWRENVSPGIGVQPVTKNFINGVGLIGGIDECTDFTHRR